MSFILKMKFILVLLLCGFSALGGVTITSAQDKTHLLIDDTLTVTYSLSYKAPTSPDLFEFLYNLTRHQANDFELTDSNVTDAKEGQITLTFTLRPTHTGRLVFAPGPLRFGNELYFLPPISAECIHSAINVLPPARLLPLYPEKRITLSPEMRLKLLGDEVLKKTQAETKQAVEKHTRAITTITTLLLAIPTILLLLWVLIYFELLQRSAKPKANPQTAQALLLQELKKAPPAEKLAMLLRKALQMRQNAPFEQMSLQEIRLKCRDVAELSQEEKMQLNCVLDILEASCYAGKSISKDEQQKTHNLVVDLATKNRAL